MAAGQAYRLSIVVKSDSSPFVAINQPVFVQGPTGLIADTPEEDLVGAFRTECEASYLACITSALRLVKYQVGVAPDFATTFELDLGITGPVGTQGSDPLPPRTASVLSFRSATPGRRGRGRMYLPPASELSSSTGAPTANHITAMNALAVDMQDAMALVTASHIEWFWNIWSGLDATARLVSGFTSRGVWGSQRDRTRLFAAG